MTSQSQIGSMQYNLKSWATQRLASLVVVLYFLTLLICFLLMPHSYLAWQFLFAYSWLKIWTEIAMLAFSWMTWLEIQNLLIDCIKSVVPRILLLLVVALWLLGCFVYLTQVIWN